MKKLVSILISLFFMISCANSSPALDYDDFSSSFISWDTIFRQKDEQYYIYFYSEHCFYCQQIKEKILVCIKNSATPCYLLTYLESIPIASDIEQTIGATSLDDLWFGGTPSLLLIEMKTVTKNILGVQKINDYLPSWDEI